MILSKIDCFSWKQEIPANTTDAAVTTASKCCLDRRLNGDEIDHEWYIYGQFVGFPADGSVSVIIQTTDEAGATWTDVDTVTVDEDGKFAVRIPRGLKRYFRLSYVVASLSTAVTVTAGIVPDVEHDVVPKMQTFWPMQDLNSGARTDTPVVG